MPKFAVQILGFKKDIDSEKTIVKIRNWSIRLLYSVNIDILLFFILLQLAVTMNWFEFKLSGNCYLRVLLATNHLHYSIVTNLN